MHFESFKWHSTTAKGNRSARFVVIGGGATGLGCALDAVSILKTVAR